MCGNTNHKTQTVYVCGADTWTQHVDRRGMYATCGGLTSNLGMSLVDCKAACSGAATCTGFNFNHGGDSSSKGCYLLSADLSLNPGLCNSVNENNNNVDLYVKASGGRSAGSGSTCNHTLMDIMVANRTAEDCDLMVPTPAPTLVPLPCTDYCLGECAVGRAEGGFVPNADVTVELCKGCKSGGFYPCDTPGQCVCTHGYSPTMQPSTSAPTSVPSTRAPTDQTVSPTTARPSAAPSAPTIPATLTATAIEADGASCCNMMDRVCGAGNCNNWATHICDPPNCVSATPAIGDTFTYNCGGFCPTSTPTVTVPTSAPVVVSDPCIASCFSCVAAATPAQAAVTDAKCENTRTSRLWPNSADGNCDCSPRPSSGTYTVKSGDGCWGIGNTLCPGKAYNSVLCNNVCDAGLTTNQVMNYNCDGCGR